MESERRSGQGNGSGTALARQSTREMRTYDLDDVPIYASTGTRRIRLNKTGTYWIEIKEELDFGEQTILDNASVIGVQREPIGQGSEAGQTVRLDLPRQRFLTCAVWLVGWKLPNDEEGKPIRFPRNLNDRIDTIKALNPKWGEAIIDIISTHVVQQTEAEEAAQMKADQDAMMEKSEEFVGENENGESDSAPQQSISGEFSVVAQ